MVTRSPKAPKRRRQKDPVTQYAKDVVGGKIVAGPHVRNACRRHLDDLASGSARGIAWDLAAALRVIEFFPDVLRLSQTFDGQPFNLHPAQAFIVGSLFGWRRKDGTRRFRRAYIEQGKGNGKSPLAAGIGMYCLLADGEMQAEVYAGASMKSQAMVMFRDAVSMWRQSPALASRLTPSGGNPIWNLAHLDSGSFFRPISTDEAHSGPRPSCALLDEIHEHRDGNMIEMLERGFKSRRSPLLFMITNSGFDRNSVCWREHVHAVRVAAGNPHADKDPAYVYDADWVARTDDAFGYVCGLDAGDDPLADEACWIKANPLIGLTMPVDEVRRAVQQAKTIPGKLNEVLRLHLCQWTDADTAWMARDALEAVLSDFDPAEHAGAVVKAGIDLSATQDITAAAFCVETGTVEIERDDGAKAVLPTYDIWVEAWTPKDTLDQRALRDEAPYDLWAKDGWLNAVPGKVIRMDFVAARIAEIAAEYQFEELGYDAYAFRKNLEPALDEMGVTVRLTEHPQGGKRRAKVADDVIEAAKAAGQEPPQGLWMPGSLRELETLILEKRVRLRRSPVLISAMMSAVTDEDAFGNKWLSKRKATNRIDAAVAVAMVVGVATASNNAAPLDIAAMVA